MRRLPSSWNQTMAKLGLRRAQLTKSPRGGSSRKLNAELLESRRMLANGGLFTRLNANGPELPDVWGKVDIQVLSAQSGLPAVWDVPTLTPGPLVANEVAISTGDGQSVSSPRATGGVGGAVSASLLTEPDLSPPQQVYSPKAEIEAIMQSGGQGSMTDDPGSYGVAVAGIEGYAGLEGLFEYDDHDLDSPVDVYNGSILIVGMGVGDANGYYAAWGAQGSLSFDVAIGDFAGTIDVDYWGDNSGIFWDVTYGGDLTGIGAITGSTSVLIQFSAEISDEDLLSIEGGVSLSSSVYAEGIPVSNANNSFSFIGTTWGYASEGDEIPPPVFQGDFNTDGNVDENDLAVWLGNRDQPGLFFDGDANLDGIVDDEDLEIWYANAPSNLLLVTNDGYLDDNDHDFGDFTLSEALDIALDGDKIIFAPWVNEIELNGTQLTIADDVTIVGSGVDKLTIDANDLSRVFTVSAGVDATISGMTITGGDTTGNGGGIYISGNLDLINVDVVQNDADYYGGGAYVDSNGTLKVDRTTFDGNEAGAGGGAVSGVFKAGTALDVTGSTFSNNIGHSAGGGAILYYSNVGATTNLNVESSTFSGNSADAAGAIGFQNAVGTTITASIVNSTIAYNTATTLSGGGIVNLNGSTIVLHNTILANNSASNTTFHDVWGSVAGGGASSYNLIGQVGGSGLTHSLNGNKVGTTGTRIDALLAPLGEYGGRTKTHALKNSSPAIDAGKGSLSNLEDQRGFTREVDLPATDGGDGYRDIGAYEAGEGTTLIVRSDGDRNDSVNLQATTDSLRLREALALSAALAGTATISFDQSGWGDDEIQLSSTWGQLYIGNSVTIDGPGANALTIAAAPSSRVFEIGNGGVTLKGMRVTGGNVSGDGGGIYVDGTTTIDAVQIDGNIASGKGGAIFTVGNMDLTLKNSTLWNNDAGGQGGGLYVGGFVDATVINSTISGNTSSSQGGGIYRASFGSLRVVNATIAYNSAATGGGGIHSASATTRLDNTIVSDNSSTSGGPDISGTFSSSSTRNLIGIDATTGNGIDNADANGNMVGANARLKALADYGGGMLTHALYSDSDAIDEGDNTIATSFALGEDQRGWDRIVDFKGDDPLGDKIIDIGAVELAMDELYF
jgi:hypothetical protein